MKINKKNLIAATISVALVAITLPAHAATVDAKAAALVPSNLKTKGVLVVGVDATYAPNEFKDAKGNVIGWDVELFTAMAAKVGLKTKYVVGTFDQIIPQIKGGRYDAGVSSFTDTKEREAQVDFVDYFSAGIQWAARKGVTLDANNACGKQIAAQTGTTEVTDLQDKSKACTTAGKKAIKILQYDTQDQANAAVILGRADGLTADSPVTENAVKASNGKMVLAGAIYGAAPYGYALAKGTTLPKALLAALQDLKADGTYMAILNKWGVQAGAVSTYGINGAIN